MSQEWSRLFYITIGSFFIFFFAKNSAKLSKQQNMSHHLDVVLDPFIDVSNNISITWRMEPELDRTSSARSVQSKVKRNPNHLIMARVPKTGTTTLSFLMREVFRRTHVKNVTDPGFRYIKTKQRQELFVKRYFSRPNEKKAFLSHIRFIDFREFNQTPPIWISQVRDPTERFISRYHFMRRQDRSKFQTLMEKRGVLEAEKWYNMSVDDCVSRGLPECNLKPRQDYEPSPITYLCGFESECSRHGSQWALAKAKANALEHFSMVGALEDFPRSLELMELKAPQLLDGISKLEVPQKNKTPRPNHVNETTRNILKTKFALEYDLYEFVKATFLSRN